MNGYGGDAGTCGSEMLWCGGGWRDEVGDLV